jgi:tRNA A-37 threonylcarbamoyl transferase component Bud32
MAEGEQTLRRYDLLERIAVGGMAEIFRAKAHGAHGFEKTLAVKRILPDLARDAEFETRFIAEAKLAVALTHANLVQIFDFGRFAGSLYIAMEYVDGPDLGRFLKAAAEHGESVPLGAAMHVAMEMCKGLDVAHARRVVHSDISPSNILLSRLGEVKIADFGIARAAADGGPGAVGPTNRVMGKWPYMSPEQTRGEPLDARSDLFSAAVVIYELFSGEKLFQGRDVEALVESVRAMPIPPPSSRRPSLPPALDAVLAKALARDPADRYQQASELLRALLEVSYSHTVVATAMDVAEAVRRWFPPAPEGSPAGIDADALIRADLGLGSAPSSSTSGPRVTVRGATPPMPTPAEDTGAAPSPAGAVETGKTAALPSARPPKVTFVRGEQGADGIPIWELTIAGDPAVVPRPAAPIAAPRAQRRGSALVGLAALLLVGAVVPAAWRRWHASAAGVAGAELTIESTPPGARILLDGSEAAAPTPTTLHVAAPRPEAPHRLELRLPGYRVWQTSGVALRPGDHAIYRAQLEAPATRLLVTTDPPGAEVAVDGRTVGRTPLGNVTLAADGRAHTLRLRRHGFVDLSDAITLADGQDVVVDRKLAAAPRYGTIDLHVDPWALVYLDGRQIGEAPVKGLTLPVGHHRLKLVNPVRHTQMMLAVDVPAKHAYRVKLP